MNKDKLRSYLEVATNVAVLAVALVVLGVFIQSYFARKLRPELQGGFQKGQRLATLPAVSYDSAPRTLLIAMNTGCRYCDASVPFYKQLIAEQRDGGEATHIVAVFPNTEDDVKQYVSQRQLDIEAVAKVDFSALNLTGTPTVILLDNKGTISDFWVGKLSEDEEQQVIAAIKTPKT